MASVEKTYGDALFSLLKEEDEKSLTEVLGQLKAISEIFCAEPTFVKLLCTPTVSTQEKQSMLKDAFGGKVHEYVLNFLMVLTENGRIKSFDKILAYFTTLHNDYKNIADITVTSAFELSPEAAEKIRTKMAAVTGKNVNMTFKTDKSVIGGVVISYDNTVIDGSVRSRLESLRNDIAGTIA